MIELRFVVPNRDMTLPEHRVLQWRETKDTEQGPILIRDWTDVPFVPICEPF